MLALERFGHAWPIYVFGCRGESQHEVERREKRERPKTEKTIAIVERGYSPETWALTRRRFEW